MKATNSLIFFFLEDSLFKILNSISLHILSISKRQKEREYTGAQVCALSVCLHVYACLNVYTWVSTFLCPLYVSASLWLLSLSLPSPTPVPCAGNWTWDTAPRAGSRVGCWVFLACKHVCHFRGQGCWSQLQPTHGLAVRRALLPGARSSRVPQPGVSLPQPSGLMWAGGGRLGGRMRGFVGEEENGGVARRTPHPIIKPLIKSPWS